MFLGAGIQDAAAIQRVEDADVFSGVRKLLDQGGAEMGICAMKTEGFESQLRRFYCTLE